MGNLPLHKIRFDLSLYIGFFCDLWSKGMEEENSGVFYSFYRFFLSFQDRSALEDGLYIHIYFAFYLGSQF